MSLVKAAVTEWDAGVYTPLNVQAAIGRAEAAELAGESIREDDRRTLDAYIGATDEGRIQRELHEQPEAGRDDFIESGDSIPL